MGVLIYGIHAGIVGVICFLMVSGYAMSGLLQAAFPRPTKDAGAFYLNRFVRLAPQYYFYIAACFITVVFLGWRESEAQTGAPDLLNLAAHLTLIPLMFYMFSTSIGHFLLNPPTWSLGLEACFYLALPWILTNRTMLWVCALGGGVTWATATHGLINPDYYAYRLLPGTLVFFLVGVALERRDWPLYGLLAGFFCLDGLSLYAHGSIDLIFNRHMLVGAAIGCVTVPLLALFRRRKWDDFLGSVSYGTYLAHWIFVTALRDHFGKPWAVSTAILGSIAAGWATFRYVEKPTLAYRRSIVRQRVTAARLPSRPAWPDPPSVRP